jgi:hypothetical protein
VHSRRRFLDVERPASHVEVMAGDPQRGVVADPELTVIGVGGPPTLSLEPVCQSLDDVEVPAQTP